LELASCEFTLLKSVDNFEKV